ncbi:uncharacterized protein LOC8027154 [Ixodes scapularis]|uniref:uncharacterized protein LOC8027154 n=1 Tax=Ixodes scapularis TaxID=6945 RepID=UPI001C390D6F|nr:uncharacterized protein LOC8027154 [Ixodes scapularis]
MPRRQDRSQKQGGNYGADGDKNTAALIRTAKRRLMTALGDAERLVGRPRVRPPPVRRRRRQLPVHRRLSGPRKVSAATWTVQENGEPVSFVSHTRWRDQPRCVRGAAPDTLDELFRGRTLQDRHPNEPRAVYSEAEVGSLCPICGTLVFQWEAHAAGALHLERVAALSASCPEPTESDLQAALHVLQAAQPWMLAASMAAIQPPPPPLPAIDDEEAQQAPAEFSPPSSHGSSPYRPESPTSEPPFNPELDKDPPRTDSNAAEEGKSHDDYIRDAPPHTWRSSRWQ